MYASSLFDSATQKYVTGVDNEWLSLVKLGKIDRLFKRIIDFFGAIFLISILLPIFILIAFFIKLESRGPVLFWQKRYGMGGKFIFVAKFRSMFTDRCDASGVSQTVKGDSRITKVGAVLRRTNLDELPQLWNVLIGEMSLVGPRCHPVGMLAAGMLYEHLVPQYHIRHVVRPGITGLAQVRGLRGPTVLASKARQRIASDMFYVANFSIWLDFKILYLTVKNEIFKSSGF